MSVDGVLGVNSCQMRWMGHRFRADISIGVASTLTVGDGHSVGEHVRETLRPKRDSWTKHSWTSTRLRRPGAHVDTGITTGPLVDCPAVS